MKKTFTITVGLEDTICNCTSIIPAILRCETENFIKLTVVFTIDFKILPEFLVQTRFAAYVKFLRSFQSCWNVLFPALIC